MIEIYVTLVGFTIFNYFVNPVLSTVLMANATSFKN